MFSTGQMTTVRFMLQEVSVSILVLVCSYSQAFVICISACFESLISGAMLHMLSIWFMIPYPSLDSFSCMMFL